MEWEHNYSAYAEKADDTISSLVSRLRKLSRNNTELLAKPEELNSYNVNLLNFNQGNPVGEEKTNYNHNLNPQIDKQGVDLSENGLYITFGPSNTLPIVSSKNTFLLNLEDLALSQEVEIITSSITPEIIQIHSVLSNITYPPFPSSCGSVSSYPISHVSNLWDITTVWGNSFPFSENYYRNQKTVLTDFLINHN